ALALRDTARSNFRFPNLLARDPVLRRKALKQLAYRLPGRPALVFAYLYFIRLGCFDGKPGLLFCTMRSIYEYMIDIKVRELNRRQAGLPV
ncbi:MAG TPA: glycosyltransferase family 2 protein, partial [Verrucomicrobiae bacterium]|nr:glycosyltransferase family 2 protein [Verrucomicrobiae bacterium]